MANKAKMTQKAASRIQSHADRTGRNQGWKERSAKVVAKSNLSKKK